MRFLGNTELQVSGLCYGTLPLSPLQGCRDVEKGSRVLRYGLEQGINFLDTAELYDNYGLIRKAVAGLDQEVVIATKSYAHSFKQMAASIESARKGLDRDVIEIFLLHEQESMYTLRGHQGALECLLEAKQRGIIRAAGLSTHAVAGVRAGAASAEIDVIHPILNISGLGIIDGTLAEMLEAIDLARQMGKGIYAMKALGGGHLCSEPIRALNYARNVPGVASVAVGMASCLEVDINCRLFGGHVVPEPLLEGLKGEARMLYIAPWCEGCGACLERCPQNALRIEKKAAKVDADKCVLCGYCGAACPHFCLKIIRKGEWA